MVIKTYENNKNKIEKELNKCYMQICNVERDILFVMAHSNFTCVYHLLDRHYLSHIFLFFLSLIFIFIIYKKKKIDEKTKKQK